MPSPTVIAAHLSLLITSTSSLFIGVIAYRQWRTASDKLRFDLYERRLAVYDAAANYLEFGMKAGLDHSLDEEKIHSAYVRAWREARFLFGKESDVCRILREMQNHVLIASTRPSPAEVLYEPDTASIRLIRKEESILWITDAFDRFSDAIEPFLDFRRLQNSTAEKRSL